MAARRVLENEEQNQLKSHHLQYNLRFKKTDIGPLEAAAT